MAFSYDPTTSRGRVRLLVSDTDREVTANQIFNDAEIDALLALENNEVWSAAAAACESIAASTSRSAIAWRVLGRSLEVDKKKIPEHFMALAERYRKRSIEPSEEIDSFDYTLDRFGDDLSEYVGDPV